MENDNNKTVRIYTTTTCPYCFALADWLDELGVKYENHDANQLPNVTMVPITFIGTDDKLVGFDRPALLKSLRAHGIID